MSIRPYQNATLNDSLRKTFTGGKVVMTRGVKALVDTVQDQKAILRAVREFDAFTPENDPYGEHDFGAVEACGKKLFWKIDYYDRARVLTIMLADEQ